MVTVIDVTAVQVKPKYLIVFNETGLLSKVAFQESGFT